DRLRAALVRERAGGDGAVRPAAAGPGSVGPAAAGCEWPGGVSADPGPLLGADHHLERAGPAHRYPEWPGGRRGFLLHQAVLAAGAALQRRGVSATATSRSTRPLIAVATRARSPGRANVGRSQ